MSLDTVMAAAAACGAASFIAWLVLVFGRGGFWRAGPVLPGASGPPDGGGEWPTVAAVVPARNEADVLPDTLPALLAQDYPGEFHVYVVDDRSDDGTAQAALRAGRESGRPDRLTVVTGEARPRGWAGKVWALSQGASVATAVGAAGAAPEYLWLTDADVLHPAGSLGDLARLARRRDLDLVSVMVLLRADTWIEKLLVPAFVYFFGKLHPFRWANDPRKKTAAAAGGCVLVRRRALEEAGGLAAIAGELIDDCALAALVKREAGGRIWLGLSREMRSARGYGGLGGVWAMVARTAFTQLRYSSLLLAVTVFGMLLIYAAPVAAAVLGAYGIVAGGRLDLPVVAACLGAGAWLLMAATFTPMLRWYGTPVPAALLLPAAGLLYTAMTLHSAVHHWSGHGTTWKGRAYDKLS